MSAARFGVIDVGTNSVLLLVAESDREAGWRAVHERAELTRLGRGVDQTRTLAEGSMDATLKVIEAYVAEARALGVQEVVATVTSAARDATNGADFLARVKARTGVALEILPGDEEARLSFASVAQDPTVAGNGALVVIDIGGGSTELVYGDTGGRSGNVGWRHSFDVGAVRLTERFVNHDPPLPTERAAADAALREVFQALPPPPAGARVVGVAGTVTTLFALSLELRTYDAKQVHGGMLDTRVLATVTDILFRLPVSERRALPGLQPKRADVIPMGALILTEALRKLGATRCVVSDRGLRWGLLERFQAASPPA